MGLIDFLLRLFGLKGTDRTEASAPARPSSVRRSGPTQKKTILRRLKFVRERWYSVKKSPQRLTSQTRPFSIPEVKTVRPYPFANHSNLGNGYLDLSQDGDAAQLNELELPHFSNPLELANWLQIPVGQLAWLTNQFEEGYVPKTEASAHYHHHWMPKRNYGCRLIESPKPLLKQVQRRILRDILDNVPAHSAAHGFVQGNSILTNAQPHCGQRVILKFDLENFYPHVRFPMVTAIFRSMGYSREAAIWLARLCTSRLPLNSKPPSANPEAYWLYRPAHLPQGAPTSPALANLAAYSLDLRLDGLARAFGAKYTRYADDLTFSGDERFLHRLKAFIPFVSQIIKECGFTMHKAKRRIIRSNQHQSVTGVTVNEHPNINRKEYDRLRAILHNCVRHGAESQNREQHPDFQAHLRGRIAHAKQLNPKKGEKLQAIYERITW
ncbi:MAG: reverse transcriptase family protein [Planctomycetaceae bacterium]